jgi:hypothetical protein
MAFVTKRFCPYCSSALIGLMVMLGVPGLSDVTTPLGKFSVLMFWVPLASAVIRHGILRVTRLSYEFARSTRRGAAQSIP